MATQDAITPLSSSTHSAPFVMEEGRKTSNATAAGGFVVLHKLRSKTVLQSVPEGRSVRADSNQSTQSSQMAATPGEWSVGFAGCSSGADVALVVCCPCFPAAKLHSLLGGSIESGMVFFGGLVFTMLVLVGLSNSNMSSAATADAAESRTYAPAMTGDDKFVAQDADPTTRSPLPTPSTGLSNAELYRDLAVVLLALFLLGVAFLRTKTRHRFSIPGSRALDCLQSFACCWCVLSQSRAHVEKHNRFELGLDTPTETPSSTLPAYT